MIVFIIRADILAVHTIPLSPYAARDLLLQICAAERLWICAKARKYGSFSEDVEAEASYVDRKAEPGQSEKDTELSIFLQMTQF